MRVLAVDDEPPALDELGYLLEADPRVASVLRAGDAPAALRLLRDSEIDAVFLDIRMPGMDGLELARALRRQPVPPPVVFVTAHDDRAVDAFALRAVDYVLKPVRSDRLAEALSRLQSRAAGGPAEEEVEETVAVELGGVTRFVALADVRFVEAHGDYARLHTGAGSHLVRVAMSSLEQRWAAAGFVRVHRSYLVSTAHITELRVEPGGGHAVRLGSGEGSTTIPVSRRHTRELKDRLVRRARDGAQP